MDDSDFPSVDKLQIFPKRKIISDKSMEALAHSVNKLW